MPEPANEDAPLFEILPPETNGMVWLKLNKDNGSVQYANLGQTERVVEAFTRWLAAHDGEERFA